MVDFDNVLKSFLVESHEIVGRLESQLISLEREPESEELVAAIFRSVHTLKGSGGFLGFTKLQSLAHAAEAVLSGLRERRLKASHSLTSALLAVVDAVRRIVGHVEERKEEGTEDLSPLLERLCALGAGNPPGETEAAPASPAVQEGTIRKQRLIDRTIRVDVDLLDKLMVMVGKLVLLRNQMLQLSLIHPDSVFTRPSQHLNLLTTELQEGVMKARLVPIRSVWDRVPRIVRDLATASAKQVRLVMEGADTELDKGIIEAITEPLIHLVRNAVHHGVEAPAAREAAGKPAEGTVLLRAHHEAGQVHIEVTDDGMGIDPGRVRLRAVQLGLTPSERVARMDDREALSLICLRGFTTAERVSEVAGRGVGMDVVKTNIEKLGGAVDIESTVGRGTSIRMKMPLTLAIIPALIVTGAKRPFVIPRSNVLEVVCIRGGKARTAIETLHSVPVYRLRDHLLPLVHLNRIFELPEPNGKSEDRSAPASLNIVILQADGYSFGLVVDEVNDVQEIVVKPLGKHLKRIATFGGATILGDGRLALILDVIGVARRSNILREAREQRPVRAAAVPSEGDKDRQSVLLLQGADQGRLAVPLSSVIRLEEISTSAIERAGTYDVAQYRGKVLPLIPLSSLLHERRRKPRHSLSAGSAASPSKMQVVVVRNGERTLGLVVDAIVDVVEEHVVLEKGVPRKGVLGSTVIRDRITEMVDVEAILRSFEVWTGRLLA